MMLGIFAANRAGGAMLLTMLVLSVAACLFSLQLRKLQKEGEALAAGNLDAQVDTKWMYWDVKRHALRRIWPDTVLTYGFSNTYIKTEPAF